MLGLRYFLHQLLHIMYQSNLELSGNVALQVFLQISGDRDALLDLLHEVVLLDETVGEVGAEFFALDLDGALVLLYESFVSEIEPGRMGDFSGGAGSSAESSIAI